MDRALAYLIIYNVHFCGSNHRYQHALSTENTKNVVNISLNENGNSAFKEMILEYSLKCKINNEFRERKKQVKVKQRLGFTS